METDTKIASNIEEGEIESESEGELYQPLERPRTTAVPQPQINQNSDAEDEVEESDEDTDSDTSLPKPKKSRKKLLRARPVPLPQKKRNNIWCSGVQEEVLTNKLIKCDVMNNIDRDRDVETYNYKAARLFPKEEKRPIHVLKRKHDRPSNRSRFTKDNMEKVELSSSSRSILQLSTNEGDSSDDIAKDIANKLCEEKEDLILRVIEFAGKNMTIELFEQTRDIEQNGGLLIMNGTRRRTPGGVFFYLVRGSELIPREKINLIFAEDRKNSVSERKKRAREVRKANALKLKQLLANDDYPTLLSHTELAIKQYKEREKKENEDEDEEEESGGQQSHEDNEVKNPPPSPATDGRENSDTEEHDKDAESKHPYEEHTLGDNDSMDIA